MRVILLKDVRKVGKKGDVIDVADGYGKNYLIKNQLAILSTQASQNKLQQEKQAEKEIQAQKKAEAEELKKQLEQITVEFKVNSGKEGKTFGSVSTKQIVKELQNQHGIKVDKRKFINARPIGALGVTNLQIELYKGVVATVKVHLSEK